MTKERWRDDIEEVGSVFWRRKAQKREPWKILGNPLHNSMLNTDK
jgi:hypothetical protein